MAKNRITIIMAAVAMALVTGPAMADESTEQEITDLKHVQQHLEQQARATKPAAAAPLQREADRLQGVIDSLERGEQVDGSTTNPGAGHQK